MRLLASVALAALPPAALSQPQGSQSRPGNSPLAGADRCAAFDAASSASTSAKAY
jgi:hypothetical protein